MLFFRPIQERRKLLQDNVCEIPGRIVHSEMKIINVGEERLCFVLYFLFFIYLIIYTVFFLE